MIKKQGNKFNVYDSTGRKLLGSHPTREKALAQLRAIEWRKGQQPKGGK